MNFITRNLGWLLLLAFFVFMLFIISSSNPNEKTNSGTLNASGEIIGEDLGEDELEKLAKKIDEEEKLEEGSEESIVTDNSEIDKIISDESDVEEATEEKGFFAKLFSRSSEDEQNEQNEQDEESEEEADTQTDEEAGHDEGSHDHDHASGHIVSTDGTSSQTSKNLVKGSSTQTSYSATVAKYAPEVLGYELPGIDLETKVGKNFDIGVHSLKINNKTFTRKLGYLMNGDTVKQISPANSYGCFEMQVLSSSVKRSIGKTGYVCKKYLTASSYTETEKSVEVETPLFSVETNIGDVIEVNKGGVNLGDIELSVGDRLDQMSEVDNEGCFIVRVFSSEKEENLGKTGKICMSELY